MKITDILKKLGWALLVVPALFLIKLLTGKDTNIKDINKLSKDISKNEKLIEQSSKELDKALKNVTSTKPNHSKNVKRILKDL